jgi:GxxExxY protein
MVRVFQAEPNAQLDDLARRVIGACVEVHRHLGAGFVESVYEEALCIELAQAQVPFERQVVIAITYKGVDVGFGRLDLLVGAALIVELKAVEALAPVAKAAGGKGLRLGLRLAR